ncbi:hypothetical protein R3P38DRAFT_2715268 [Favolaschia claudopus]|uniref:Transferase n=1 Tax=Favolaschia claudopus TaxID=2862362 RepID=A0AAW0B0J7_9AGAR
MFSRLRSLFFTPTPPPNDARVVPCSGVDLAGRDVVVTTGFIIDARLDVKKLEETFSLLVEQKFPRAGARLALRNGTYEFHVPNTFDAQTPAVAFTAADHCEPYASSTRPPVSHLLNASSSEPWICSSPLIQPFFRSSSCPASLKDFLVPNTPLIHVHVAVFDDLTFFGITSTHLMFDAIGISTLMHAWQRLLAGDALEDIPGMPWDIEPFTSYTKPAPGYMLHRGWYDLVGFTKFSFIVRFIWKIIRDQKEEHKVVRIPKAYLEDRKREVMEELSAEESKEWVGSSDVLMAWWFKTSYFDRTDPTPLHIHLTVNLRGMPLFPRLPGSTELAPISSPFINNAVVSLSLPPMPVNTLRSMSLRNIALIIRRVITIYKNDLDGIAADVRSVCAQNMQVFPHPPGAEYSLQSNLRSGGLGKLDFSGAATPVGGKTGAARVRYVTAFPQGPGMPFRGTGMVLFEDEKAVWMNQTRGAKEWERLRKAGTLEFL